MAEERDLALARATASDETGDAEPSKAELQRRMEEARENISQTVAEIKDTVVNQYNAVKETLDWREQVRRRPVAWSVGALGVGFLVGYGVAGVFVGDGDEDEEYSTEGLSPADTRVFELPPSSLERASSAAYAAHAPSRSYAAQAITGPSIGGAAAEDEGESASPTYQWSGAAAQGSQGGAAEEEEEKGPGLIERFKQTKAYDKLEGELSTLGDRFIEELSRTAQTVVLPLLFKKLKDLVGVDLSGKQESQRGQQRTVAQSGAGAAVSASQGGTANTSSGGAQPSSTEQGGSSYGTSENRGYGTASA